MLISLFKKLANLIRRIFVPKGDTPFDWLKHYVSLLLAVIGLMALLWAGKQIVYPPIVITVAELPEPLKKDPWLNLEITHALINQIERMRTVVKGERDPNFQAVLNPPNIVVKSGDFSLNIQEQLLTPLGSLLGRSPGEVHLALTCYHPGCMRTSDSECRDSIPAQIADNAKAGQPPGANPKPQPNQYLCLRVTADIRRGPVHRRLTPRLVLSNETYDAETTKQMARIAEEVAFVADPATAALYFYRRVKQEGAASRSFTNDPDLVSELRGEAFRAAEQADGQDVVSACWAHSVRAHIAIDRSEFSLAETYIARANEIPWWRHLRNLTLPTDCGRLIFVAEIALARRLAPSSSSQTYPPHPDDTNRTRRQAAARRATRILDDLGGGARPSWVGFFRKSVLGKDLAQAAAFARAEVGLVWLTPGELCQLLHGAGPEKATDAESVLVHDFDADEDGQDADEWDQLLEEAKIQKPTAWSAIQASVGMLKALQPGHRFTPLARQAALDFTERLSRNTNCLEQVQALAERLYLNHPDDSEMARLLAGLIETSALAEADEKDDKKRPNLNRARRIYERMVDIGDDKVDIFALSRLALINTAFDRARREQDRSGPSPLVLRHVTRAWQRFQRENYPTDIRHHAETILTLWGSLLLASYPEAIVDADLSKGTEASNARDAAAKKAEFQRAIQVLFPAAQPTRLADLPKLSGIGTPIGCLCLLMRMTGSDETSAKFFLTKVNRWQRSSLRFQNIPSCSRDLLPARTRKTRTKITPEQEAAADEEAKADFEAANTKLERVKKLCHVAT
ncbi:MAG TPA: hypothetical protein VF601_11435 [Beijerinckiaceae bacterium]|jgi:hypothetical protein